MKTLISAGVAYSHFKEKAGSKNIILCPSHITAKWKREVETYIPNAKGYIVKDFSDLKKIEHKIKYPNPKENVFVILSKENARSTYELMPAVNWSISKRTFTCPCCGKGLMKKVRVPGLGLVDEKYGPLDMATKKAFNKECNHCKTNLWRPAIKDPKATWIKLGREGWVMQRHIEGMYNRLIAKGNTITSAESGTLSRLIFARNAIADGNPNKGLKAPRKYSLAKYIKDNLKFDYSIIDEIHEYKAGDSKQGNAMADIVRSSKKMIGATGTLLNGYADGLFYILYRAFPRMMKKEGFEYCDEGEFMRQFGVIKKTNNYIVRRGGNAELDGSSKEKRLPGVSPIVFTKFLLENAVFLSLADLDGGLPAYQEIPIGVEMDQELRNEYEDLERRVRRAASTFSSAGAKVMGRMTQILGSFADTPFDMDDVVDPATDDVLIEMKELDKKVSRNKELELLSLVKEKVSNGEKVLVYCEWTKITEVQERLQKLLSENDIDSFILTSTNTSEREEKINKELRKGKQVMICNPRLVETGLDLLDFTTIVFYQTGYNIFTLRQASRRSWRLSQDKDIEVYFMYYKDTIQELAMSLMATKLQASMAIEGNMGEEGLRALSNNEDLLSQIASSVVEGIKDIVETSSYIVERTERTHDTSRVRTPLSRLLIAPPVSFSLRYLKRPATNELSKPKTKTMKTYLNDVNLLFCV